MPMVVEKWGERESRESLDSRRRRKARRKGTERAPRCP